MSLLVVAIALLRWRKRKREAAPADNNSTALKEQSMSAVSAGNAEYGIIGNVNNNAVDSDGHTVEVAEPYSAPPEMVPGKSVYVAAPPATDLRGNGYSSAGLSSPPSADESAPPPAVPQWT